jgi:ABC-type Zn2+ transport system substrate-binding protein/surface adhesin
MRTMLMHAASTAASIVCLHPAASHNVSVSLRDVAVVAAAVVDCGGFCAAAAAAAASGGDNTRLHDS